MKPDKIKVYILEFLLLVILSFTLFVSKIYSRIILACLLAVCAIATSVFLKKRKVQSVHSKKVTIVLTVFAIIYLLGFYLMGLHFGYYRPYITFNYNILIQYIIPIAIIIISSEMMRNILLAQNTKFTKIMTFFVMVIVDLLIYNNIYNADSYDEIVEIIGFTFFSSVACNLLYNYVAVRYGIAGNIVYRLITVLYAYIIPYIPNVYIFFRSILRMVYPYIIYSTLKFAFERNIRAVARQKKRKTTILKAVIFIIMAIITMLISCYFRYGILIIATGSMTGTINKGDAVFFEKYDGKENIEVGQIIIFMKDDLKVVHRVIDKKTVNGEIRYFTKGDANQNNDEGYITNSNVYGLCKARLPYIGYPSILLREVLTK